MEHAPPHWVILSLMKDHLFDFVFHNWETFTAERSVGVPTQRVPVTQREIAEPMDLSAQAAIVMGIEEKLGAQSRLAFEDALLVDCFRASDQTGAAGMGDAAAHADSATRSDDAPATDPAIADGPSLAIAPGTGSAVADVMGGTADRPVTLRGMGGTLFFNASRHYYII